MKLPKYWLIVGLASLVLAGGCGELGNSGSISNAPPPPAPPSGSLARSTGDLLVSTGPEIAGKNENGAYSRSRVVKIDPTAMPGDQGGTVKATLFNGLTVTVEFGPVTTNSDGSRYWTGHVIGDSLSSVVLVQNQDVISASVVCSLGAFELKWLGEGRVEVRERDRQTNGRCQHGPKLPRGAGRPVLAKGDAEAAANSIDMYVVYNAGVRVELGSTAAVQARIVQFVAQANTCFVNSNADVQLNLIGSEEVSYDQKSQVTITNDDLTALASGPAFEPVRAKRTPIGADLVALLLNIDPPAGTPFTSGIAFTPDKASGLQADAGFSVTALQGFDNFTFAHEVGHNFGCQHDVGQNPIPPAEALYPFAYGFRKAGVFGTVMAYPQGNEFNIPNFTVPNFSNPSISVGAGNVTGVVGSSENFKTLTNSAPGVANYTVHVTPSPSPTPTPSPAVGTVNVNLISGWNGLAMERQVVGTLNTTASIPIMATYDGAGYQTSSFSANDINNTGDGTRRGFFVFATSATSFNYDGSSDAQGNFANLKSGYNLCSFVTSTNIAGNTLKAFQNNVQVPISTVALTTFFEIQPNGSYAPVDVSAGGILKPGKAYFVFATGTARLTW